MMTKPSELSVWRKLSFGLLICLLIFMAAEGALRLAGFHHPTTIERMSFQFPMEDFNARASVPFLQRDPVLFWRPRPNVLGHNSKGFYGAEFQADKPKGVFRIVCLGDSCTHYGPNRYPYQLQQMLNTIRPGRFEVINAGVMGYSSYQGLTLLRTEVAAWKPDVVTMYFGWNDHWRAQVLRDSQQGGKLSVAQRLHNALDCLRTYQFWHLVVSKAVPANVGRVQNRVELGEYRANLEEMKRVGDQIGADTWFLTAPHAFDLDIPSFLVELTDTDHLIAVHGAYNDQVRSVADKTGATLIDLDRLFEHRDKVPLFENDHIHLSELGKGIVAQILLQKLVERGYLEPNARK